jgi:hypothetical protein
MNFGNDHGCAQIVENDVVFGFLVPDNEDANEFVIHFLVVRGDESWVSFHC